MGYREKFQSSQSKALNQIIATKIDRDMRVLRASVESSSSAPRRWIWELIQNAKDVHYENRGIRVKVQLNISNGNNKLIFRHNGMPFSADNIRFLIEQISTKERSTNQNGVPSTTGKFGTGFLSTHLLSEVVHVQGVAKEPDLDYRKFSFTLDRTGIDLDGINEGVNKAKESVENLDDLEPFLEYETDDFNTEFHYPLEDDISIEVAKKGISDLHETVAYALLFVSDIEEIEIESANVLFKRKVNTNSDDSLVQIRTVETLDTNAGIIVENKAIAILKDNHTSIAIPVKVENDKIEIIELTKSTPRLFCDFPLVGTELFPFPVIINAPTFNPTDPRDGIFLNESSKPNPLIEANREIIQSAIELYFELLEYAAVNEWKNLHLLANIHGLNSELNWVSKTWYNQSVLQPIRERLLLAKIVNTADGGSPAAILDLEGNKYIWFPSSFNKEIRHEIWELASDWFPHCLPRQTEVDLWYKLSWDDCGKLTLDQFAKFIENKGSISDLKGSVLERDVFEWLNQFYDLIKKDSKAFDTIINKYRIFPNQHGEFRKSSQLYADGGNIGDEFKEILELLNYDIRAELLDERIRFSNLSERVRDRDFIVKEISSEVTSKSVDRETASEYREAFGRLLIWFKKNEHEARKLFPDLFKRKHLLYDEEVIIDNMDKAEQLNDLLKDYDAESLEELKVLIEKGKLAKPELLPVTQDILASLGITSVEEWNKALEDKDLAAIFAHQSTPSHDMFVYVQSLIEKAKEKIITYLISQDAYDLAAMEEIAPTVIAGITKNGIETCIVTRPAYSGEVILYYGAERDILDYEVSELWVDTGTTVKRITLGHILKKAGINKFPI